MCGISVIIGINSANSIRAMVDIQSHRGPDDSGIVLLSQKPPVYFGHNRLSIIDLTHRGHQPMFSKDKSLCISYNGEIYNFREIRDDLQKLGYVFFSRTDTEVILNAYDCWGLNSFEKFKGMFAFAIYDKKKNRIIVARDHLGVKPLYYWTRNNQFVFASEIKALLQVREIKQSLVLDMEAFTSYVSLLWSPYTKTPFESIKRLPQGTFMEINLYSGEYSIKEYWKVVKINCAHSFNKARQNVLDHLSHSVKQQMIADVKVGAFFSGGLDSSAIAALMSKDTSEQIEAFTIAFSKDDQKLEAMMDDYKYAKEMSDRFGYNLNKIEISSNETAELLPKIVYHLDEPIGDPAAVNTYLMAKLAKKNGVTVLLSGQGSDEIFGGYRRYLASLILRKYKNFLPAYLQIVVNRILSKMPVTVGGKGIRCVRWMKRLLLDKPPDPFGIYYSLSAFIHLTSLSKLLSPDVFNSFSDRIHRQFFESVNGSYIDRMCYTDIMLFLPNLNLNYCDKATMAASIECRVPFCDHELVEYSFSLPANYKIRNFQQKYILKKSLESILPHNIIYRPKMPFSSPLRAWVKKGLHSLIDEYLDPDRIRRQGLFNADGIKELIDQDREGIQDNAHIIYGLLTMQIWLDIFNVSY
jgi:asparagine synthase (glutamine-hydrolysing)